ncbi:MAG: hypothetical protein ACAI44_31855 [Candidatus Sericytochromatia bacterium]
MAKSSWQHLNLPPETPRAASLLTGLDLMRGLRGWQGFGRLAGAGAVLAFAAIAIVPGEAGLKILAGLALAGITAGFLLHARRQLALRRVALLTGLPVTGSIIRHGKRFNPFSSRLQRTVTVLFWLPEGQQTALGVLAHREQLRDLPRGRRVIGLWLPDRQQIWLPLEIGLELEAEVLEPKEFILEESEEKAL